MALAFTLQAEISTTNIFFSIFFLFFFYFSLLIFYTSPRQWGLRGYLLLAKVELIVVAISDLLSKEKENKNSRSILFLILTDY